MTDSRKRRGPPPSAEEGLAHTPAETSSAQDFEQAELGGRAPQGLTRWLILTVAVAWSVFQLYATWAGNLDAYLLRSAHLAFAFALVFLVYPGSKRARRDRVPAWDWALGLAATGSALYAFFEFQNIVVRGGVPNTADLWMGSAAVVLLLVAAWRSLGPALPIIAGVLMLYALTGPRGLIPTELPALLQTHAGATWPQLTAQLYLTTESIFGVPIGVSATFVFLFVLFGALLDRAGAGLFFIQLAYAMLGRFRGGPAKAAVLASGMTGIVSGSSVSNVVTTGTFTIPLMKRVGYPAEKAGGIEVAASSNGQLMPPVMGAAAFIMATFLNIPYTTLILAALVPALLAYLALFVTVHIEALKMNLKGVPREELPVIGPIVRSGWHYFLPIVYLIYALAVVQLTPERAALNTIFAMFGLILVQELWRGFRNSDLLGGLKSGSQMIVGGLEGGARGMVSIAIATAAAGIIVGVVTITGIGYSLTDLIGAISGGNIIVVLILAQLIALLLGMGLPTTANYIVMASLVVPVIAELAGLDRGDWRQMLPVHMFVFYFGIMADSTPPVALAGYAAAAISKGNGLMTGVQGFIYDMRTALLAYMLFFNPKLLLIGITGPGEAVWIAITALIGLTAFTSATLGFLHRPSGALQRLLLLAAAVSLITPGLLTDALGISLLVAVYAWQKITVTNEPRAPLPQAA